jgi:phosphohistidine phosphatase SixA
MKKIIIAIVLIAGYAVSIAQSIPAGVTRSTRIYLVRHAEKGITPPNDPPLTTAGKTRAGDLMRRLGNSGIDRIYVTQFIRTQMTGDSLRIQLGIDTVKYAGEENGTDLFHKITGHADFARQILIIGHSNTIPDYIVKLGVANYPQADIDSLIFDNLFLVYYKRSFPLFGKLKAVVRKMKYGVASIASGAKN